MAYVTGVLLLVLVAIAMPLKYIGHQDAAVAVVGPAHGFLYMVYLVTAFDLAVRAKWSFQRTLLLLIAGTVPFLSFVVERKARNWVRRRDVGDGAAEAIERAAAGQ
jgi:integral membrane protein